MGEGVERSETDEVSFGYQVDSLIRFNLLVDYSSTARRSPFSRKRRLNVYFASNCCQKLNICKPSPVGEGVKRSLTDEESRKKDNFQSLPFKGGGIAKQ